MTIGVEAPFTTTRDNGQRLAVNSQYGVTGTDALIVG